MVAAHLSTRKENVYPTTTNLLDCEPDHFAGQSVSLKTNGFETTPDPTVFMYRRITDQPPTVIIRFRTAPKNLPPVVIGRCLGRQGASVLVVECRAAN